MHKEITLTIPTDWDVVSFNKYLKLQKELKNYEDNEDAMVAIMLQQLCGLDVEYLAGLSKNDYNTIKKELANFTSHSDYPLKRIVKWKGKKYGFEPNLSQMAYGAYLDAIKYDTLSLDEKWPNIMNILYREIESELGDLYQIRPYRVDIDNTHEIKEWGMDIHFGAYFFFINLLMDLVSSIPNFSREVAKYPNLLPILRKSGVTISQLLNLRMEI